jgi:hypothetical protein
MILRRIALFVGVVVLIVGVVGLLTPVSVSPAREPTVSCGSAIAPDLSAARAHDDRSAANIPVLDEVVIDTDYIRLCQMELENRRIWTISVAVAGALAIVGALALGALSNRASRSP